MTPAKRRPATPASKGPTRAAPKVPDVPTPPPVRTQPPDGPVADELVTIPAPPAATKDGTLLGPEGEPISQEAADRDAGGHSAPPTETGPVHPEDRATTRPPRRSGGLYPLPVWPD